MVFVQGVHEINKFSKILESRGYYERVGLGFWDWFNNEENSQRSLTRHGHGLNDESRREEDGFDEKKTGGRGKRMR